MGTYRTELTHGLRVLIQRQCALAASWVATLSQLQPTDDENSMVEILAEIAAHVQLITARGYLTMTEVTAAYVRVLEAFIDHTVPHYRQSVFPIYMHPNGSLRREWREKSIGGIIPLSSRVDVSAEFARLAPDRKSEYPIYATTTHLIS